MQIGMVGLGRMGGNMVRRLLRAGHQCVVSARSRESVAKLEKDGATPSDSLRDLVGKLQKPRAVWVMVPAGDVTEDTVRQLGALLDAGDAVIDGGNSYFKDDIRRAKALAEKGIDFVDAGTSGGVWGLERGYCLMIGGPEAAGRRLDPIFKTLAPGRGDVPPSQGRKPGSTAEDGYLHCGPVGAGHFVKMVHNGIEYGLMQAYAEGFDILRDASQASVPEEQRYALQLGDIAELWRRGSVVGSWLLDLTALALARDEALADFTGSVADSGEGRWTVLTAVEQGTAAEVLSTALYKRFRSRETSNFAEKLLSAMRFQFGGHKEPARDS
jgi:6-phosphogluconate dehydrogenase